MNDKKTGSLSRIETFFMALADKTRLRLLNLMGEDEICVCFFTDVLGDSQPKISRHLAYLRNAELVNARREGKWVHYSIRWPAVDDGGDVLRETLKLLADRDDLRRDREKYELTCCSPDDLVRIARISESIKYAEADIIEAAPAERMPERASHNELEEFLL